MSDVADDTEVLTGRDRSLRNLRPPWPKGVSANPGGRPKKKPLTEALEKIYSDPKEAMAAAKALARKVRKGSLGHFQEAANRLEGCLSRSEEEEQGEPTVQVIVVNVDMRPPKGHEPP